MFTFQNILQKTSRCIHRHVKRFGKDECGATIVIFALSLPVILGFVGLGVEVGSWYKVRRDMQTATDTAAVSAAVTRAYGGSILSMQVAAETSAANNGWAVPVTVNVPPVISATYRNNTNYVETVITQEIETLFAGMFMGETITSTTYAVATTTGDQDACFLALSPNATQAINVGTASVSLTGCGVFANSNQANAIDVQPGSLTAECVSTTGNVDGIGVITTTNERCPNPRTDIPPLDDPFDGRYAIPTYDDCPAGGASSNTGGVFNAPGNTAISPAFAGTLNADGSYTLEEGVYCNGLTISSGETVHMNPGTYIMDSGDFVVQGGAFVNGTDVSIILTSKADPVNKTGAALITGTTDVALSAPTGADTSGTVQGDFIGALVIQDPRTAQSPSKTTQFTGGATLAIEGLVYAPNNDLVFNGGATLPTSDCLLLAAQTLAFNGDAALQNNCDKYFDQHPIKFGAKPGLVE